MHVLVSVLFGVWGAGSLAVVIWLSSIARQLICQGGNGATAGATAPVLGVVFVLAFDLLSCYTQLLAGVITIAVSHVVVIAWAWSYLHLTLAPSEKVRNAGATALAATMVFVKALGAGALVCAPGIVIMFGYCWYASSQPGAQSLWLFAGLIGLLAVAAIVTWCMHRVMKKHFTSYRIMWEQQNGSGPGTE
jgi:hypothetical protein